MTDSKLEVVIWIGDDDIEYSHKPWMGDSWSPLVTLESAQAAVDAQVQQVHLVTEYSVSLSSRITELETALRQCVEALQLAVDTTYSDTCLIQFKDAITKAREVLK